MRNMVLVFCEKCGVLKRYCHVRRFVDVSIANAVSTKREFMISSAMGDLEKSA